MNPPETTMPMRLLLLVWLAIPAIGWCGPPDDSLLQPGQAIGPLRPASVAVDDGAVALDAAGQLLVGLAGGASDQAGSVQVHAWRDGQWQLRQVLGAPPEFRHAGARFGHALAVHGPWLLVGAPRETVNGLAEAGTGYLFRRRDADDGYDLAFNGRIFQQGVGGSARRLGSAVAIGADFAALGVPGHSPAGSPQAGQVLLLARQPGGAWFLDGTLALPAGNPASGAAFGAVLAMTAASDQLVVAAPDQTVADQALAGRVYWFRRSAGAWQLRQQLSWTPVELLDRFGSAIAVVGDRLLVGAPARSKPGAAQSKGGGVRAYRRNESLDSWVPEHELFPDTAQSGARFGHALSAIATATGPRVLVGVPRRDLGTVLVGVRSQAGEAVVFEPQAVAGGYAWSQSSALRWAGSIVASAAGNRFGSAVLLARRDGLPVAAVAAPGRSEDGLTAGWVQAFQGDRIFVGGFQPP